MSKVRYDTWDRWVGSLTPIGQRRGQFLWNTAPPWVTAAIVDNNISDDFDPFYSDREHDMQCQRFMLFAYLMWDEKQPSKEDVQAACDIVLDITGVHG